MKRFAFVVAPLLTALLAGCAADTDGDSADTTDALKGGTGTNAHPEVGRLEYTRSSSVLDSSASDAQGWCAGTLITPDIVVTDRSCSFHALVETGGFFYIDQARPDGSIVKSFRYKAKLVENMTPRNQRNSERGQFRFMRLETPVPASVAKPAVVRRTGLVDGERVTAFGYGAANSKGWGNKNALSFSYHYTYYPVFGDVKDGPHVMQGDGDHACAVFDAHGQLAAIGASEGSTNWLFGSPDWFAEPGAYYDEFAAFVADLEKR